MSARGRRGSAIAVATLLGSSGVACADSGIANVNFRWTDRAGNTHPLGFAFSDGFYNTVLTSDNPGGSGYMSQTGVGVFTGSALIGNLDFYGSVVSDFGAGATPWFRIRRSDGSLYSARWPETGFHTTTGPIGDIFNHGFDNDTFAGTAFGIGQAVAFARNYAVNRLGAASPLLNVYYDNTANTGSFYLKNVPNTPQLRVDRSDWASWDVILHEFGHHVAAWNNIQDSPGGDHNIAGDNIRGTGAPFALGAAAGSRLAWGEGIATYLGLTAVRSGNLAGAVPGLPGDEYDDWYDDYDSLGTRADTRQLNFSMNAERPRVLLGNGTLSPTSEDRPMRGEGSEWSVLLATWDYYDATNEAHDYAAYHAKTRQWCRDRVTYGDQDAWNRVITAGGGAKTFRGYWANITADAGTAAGRAKISGRATDSKDEAVAALGESLEAAGISNVPLTPDGNAVLNTRRPTFEFLEQNNSNSDFWKVLVFKNDWSGLVFASGLLEDLDTDLDEWTFTPTVDLPLGTFWWVITNSPAEMTAAQAGLAGRYDFYWSGARQFTLIPAPGAAGVLAVFGLLAVRRRRT